jgi:hypothetical protein
MLNLTLSFCILRGACFTSTFVATWPRMLFLTVASLASLIGLASTTNLSAESVGGFSSPGLTAQPPVPVPQSWTRSSTQPQQRQSVVDRPVPSFPSSFTFHIPVAPIDGSSSEASEFDLKASVTYSRGSDVELVSLVLATSRDRLRPMTRAQAANVASVATAIAATGRYMIPGEPCMRRVDDPEAPGLVMSGADVLASIRHHGSIRSDFKLH